MKRICMLLDNPFHPIDRRVYKEAKSLIENGDNVTVVCKQDHENNAPLEEDIDGISIKRYFRYNLGTSVLVDKYLQAHFDLINNISDKFDCYHCHDTETWPIGYILSQRDKAKLVCDSHEFFPDYIEKANYTDNLKYEASKIWGLVRGRYIQNADGVITVGNIIANLLQKQYALAKCPTVLYNSRYRAEAIVRRADLLRSRFGIDSNTKILLFHGNIECSRGLENIIESLAYIKNNVVLAIAGQGQLKYIDSLHQYAAALSVAEKVVYCGYLEPRNLLDYIASADVNVYFPVTSVKNIDYSAPNKFFDYIFAATPFVILRLEEMADISNQYNVGYVCDNVKDMAEKIDKLLTDESDYAQKRVNCQRAQEDLCWEKQEAKLLNLYQQLWT